MISQDGIIVVSEFCPSPNFDERPKNAVIDLIVIHAISLPAGCYNTKLIKDLFLTLNFNLEIKNYVWVVVVICDLLSWLSDW